MAVHVLPVDDVKEHAYGEECECRPIAETGDENGLYRTPFFIHFAFDYRECFEPEIRSKGWQVLER